MRPILLASFLLGAIASAGTARSEPAAEPSAPAATPASSAQPAAAALPEATPAPTPPEPAPAAAASAESQQPPPSPATPTPVPAAPPAPATPPPTRDATPELAARLAFLEQVLLSQRDREIALIQETNRLVTIYSLALGGVGLAALLASAWIFYKSMVSAARAPLAMASSPAVADSANLLPASSPADAGIGRVRSSGHRLQSRMSELEDRLSELEDLAGKAPGDGSDGETPPRVAGEASLNSDSEIAVPAETRAERIIPRAAILTRKAEALANLGKLQEALAVLDEAASSDPTLEDTHMVRGRVLEKMGRLGDALEAYDRAVGIDDANTGALLLKAGILNRQERFSEALACYERALEAHKGNS